MSGAIPALSPRQIDVLAAYARIGDQRQAAADLGITTSTLRNYLNAAYRRLDVTSSIDAFRAMGWLQVPS